MKRIKLKYLYFLIPFLVPFLIIFSWFSTGKVISNFSEENLNILNPKRIADYSSTSFYPIGTGLVIPLSIVRYPTFSFLSFFQELGLPPYLIQALFLGIIMEVGLFSMYLLINKGLGMLWQISLIGCVFYLLNLFSMTQIWKRFLYNGMISWAYLPLFLFFWIKSFTSKGLKWPILFLLSSPIFSYTFAHPSYLFTFWVPATIFIIYQKYNLRLKKSDTLRLIFKFIVILILWILINIWWIYPLLKVGGSYMTENLPQWQANLESLLGVSKYFGTFDILLLRQKAYFIKDSLLSTEWFSFYNNPLVYMISIAVLLYMVYGVIKSKNQKYRGFLLSLLVIGWFISKGSNFPLGHTFYYISFLLFPLSGALRNPYEKFGLVWLLPYSIFFAIGFYWGISKVKPKWRLLSASFLITLFFIVLVYPIWNGDIFPSKHRLAIPSGYFEANQYMISKSPDRIFHIPFTTQIEKISYSWGYVGEDPSEHLFDLETLTEANLAIYNNFYKLIPKILHEYKMPQVLGLLGAKYVILHKDMTYPEIDLDSTIKTINSWEGITKEKEFGDLVIYSIDSSLVKPRVYAATTWIKIQNIEDGLKKVTSGELDAKESIITFDDLYERQKLSSNAPSITFKKISNAKYMIKVKGATGPFILVLNNTFDKLWHAEINDESINKHFIVNGFANGWLIDKKGDFDLEIVLKTWPWD